MTNAIECHGIRKTYPDFVLGDVDLLVPEGSVMGFVGPNGAGKSTTLRILMGMIRPEAGTVRVLGHEMPREQVAAKWDIGFVSEDMRLHMLETIRFHTRWMSSVFPSWDQAYAEHLLRHFDLKPDQRIKRLSHGQRAKASMVMALARRPKLLILDEPTSGLDPLARRQILDEMAAVLADEGRSILFSSHNTRDVEQISDRITFLSKGKVVFSEDKEVLLDAWRRIRVEIPEGRELPQLGGRVDVRRSGRLATITSGHYEPSLEAKLESAGVSVAGVERMTLEEIFLESVSPSGEGGA